jgi:hypothetical protein
LPPRYPNGLMTRTPTSLNGAVEYTDLNLGLARVWESEDGDNDDDGSDKEQSSNIDQLEASWSQETTPKGAVKASHFCMTTLTNADERLIQQYLLQG